MFLNAIASVGLFGESVISKSEYKSFPPKSNFLFKPGKEDK